MELELKRRRLFQLHSELDVRFGAPYEVGLGNCLQADPCFLIKTLPEVISVANNGKVCTFTTASKLLEIGYLQRDMRRHEASFLVSRKSTVRMLIKDYLPLGSVSNFQEDVGRAFPLKGMREWFGDGDTDLR